MIYCTTWRTYPVQPILKWGTYILIYLSSVPTVLHLLLIGCSNITTILNINLHLLIWVAELWHRSPPTFTPLIRRWFGVLSLARFCVLSVSCHRRPTPSHSYPPFNNPSPSVSPDSPIAIVILISIAIIFLIIIITVLHCRKAKYLSLVARM